MYWFPEPCVRLNGLGAGVSPLLNKKIVPCSQHVCSCYNNMSLCIHVLLMHSFETKKTQNAKPFKLAAGFSSALI